MFEAIKKHLYGVRKTASKHLKLTLNTKLITKIARVTNDIASEV